jgi:hypothetical protein
VTHKRGSNPPPPDGAFKPPPTSPPPRAAVPAERPGRVLPILRQHDPAAVLGLLEARKDGRWIATFARGAVPLEVFGTLDGGWRITETDYEGPYPYTQYVRRAELLELSAFTVSHNQAREGSQLMATTKNEVQLGDRVKDRVTGFQGIVVARSEYLHGCRRVGVQSEKLEEGKPTEAQWFDEPQVDVVKPAVHAGFEAKPAAAAPRRGGPQPTPPRTGLR